MSPLSSALSNRSRSWPRIAVLPFTGLSTVPSAEVLPLTAGNLKLSRPGAEPGLRAWDAADELLLAEAGNRLADKIGRASCRERVENSIAAGALSRTRSGCASAP